MTSIKNTLAKLKEHPGQAGDNDDHKYKRTYSLDVKLSPIEVEAFRSEWTKSEFNSLAAFARYKIFGGSEHAIDVYFENKREDRILAARHLSELNKQGKNLNQIAKQLSSRPDLMTQETKILIKDLRDIYLELVKIRDEFHEKKKN